MNRPDVILAGDSSYYCERENFSIRAMRPSAAATIGADEKEGDV